MGHQQSATLRRAVLDRWKENDRASVAVNPVSERDINVEDAKRNSNVRERFGAWAAEGHSVNGDWSLEADLARDPTAVDKLSDLDSDVVDSASTYYSASIPHQVACVAQVIASSEGLE